MEEPDATSISASKQIIIEFKKHSTYNLQNNAIQKVKNKKKVTAQHWTFHQDYYSTETQLACIQSIQKDTSTTTDAPTHTHTEEHEQIKKLLIQEIKKKINGYKQQDLHKKKFNETNFLTVSHILDKMIECNLQCYYCNQNMHVLYDIQRESSQWTVDRIDNDVGHNYNNFYLSCLDCNLKRRRRSDAKFLLSKQMVLVKQGDSSL